METIKTHSSALTVISSYDGTVRYTRDIVDAQFLLNLHGVERVEIWTGEVILDQFEEAEPMVELHECFDRWDHEHTNFGRTWHHQLSSDAGFQNIGIPKNFNISKIDHIFDDSVECGFRMIATGVELVDLFVETVDPIEGQKIIDAANSKAEAERQAFLAQAPVPAEYRNPTSAEMRAEFFKDRKKKDSNEQQESGEAPAPIESNESAEDQILSLLDLSLSGDSDAFEQLEDMLVSTIRANFPKLPLNVLEEIVESLLARRGEQLRTLNPSVGLSFIHIVSPIISKMLMEKMNKTDKSTAPASNHKPSTTPNAGEPGKRGRKPMLMTEQVAKRIVELYNTGKLTIQEIRFHSDTQYIHPQTGESKPYPINRITETLNNAGISLSRGRRKSDIANNRHVPAAPANTVTAHIPDHISNSSIAAVSCQ